MKASQALMTVSTRSVRPVLARLGSLGIDREPVLAAAGAEVATLDDPDARIPHELAIAVWREASRASADDAFGIHTAEQIRPGAFDVLDYATRSSSTLGEAFVRLARYHRLLHDVAVVRLEVDGDRAELTHSLPEAAGVLPRHPVEFIVAAWLVVARQATGRDFAPLEVRFRHARPAGLAEHERLFRAPVRFDQPVNGLMLDRSLLELPLVRADPGLCAVLERRLTELLEKMPRPQSFSARVREAVAKDHSMTAASADEVARKLHMSRRTMQRMLATEGTTFTKLVDALRRDLATRYLGEPAIAIAEVAFLLGFSEASAFHRAFKRWHGVTPALYRASLSSRRSA
jgi:AraC-like DNA-binding protein